MKMLLQGDDPVRATLRKQFEVAEVVKKKMTGVGCFIDFNIPANAPCVLNKQTLQISGVIAQVEGITNGIGFLLFVNNGNLSMLEGFTFDEPWPDQILNFRFSCISFASPRLCS
jgi:hypothetical protein